MRSFGLRHGTSSPEGRHTNLAPLPCRCFEAEVAPPRVTERWAKLERVQEKVINSMCTTDRHKMCSRAEIALAIVRLGYLRCRRCSVCEAGSTSRSAPSCSRLPATTATCSPAEAARSACEQPVAAATRARSEQDVDRRAGGYVVDRPRSRGGGGPRTGEVAHRHGDLRQPPIADIGGPAGGTTGRRCRGRAACPTSRPARRRRSLVRTRRAAAPAGRSPSARTGSCAPGRRR